LRSQEVIVPEPIPTQEAVLASRSRRIAAMLYELLLLIGVVGGGVLLPWIVVGVVRHVTPPGWLLWVHLFAVLALYFIWHWRRRGATLAMKTWKLRILSADGHPPSWGQCWLRFLLAWFSVGTGVGILWSWFDPDGLFLHDRLAKTRIVQWDWKVG
jgi:uncharacterized RDD family membrane protein YckC